MRDGRPSSFATTEVPALIRTRRVVRRALRDLGSVVVGMVVIFFLFKTVVAAVPLRGEKKLDEGSSQSVILLRFWTNLLLLCHRNCHMYHRAYQVERNGEA